MPGIRFFILLLVFVLMLSCKKNDKTISMTYPTSFHKSGLETVGKLRVFSSAGEIKRNSIISRFSQYDTSYFNSYANYISRDPRIMDSVNFLNEQGAMLQDESRCVDCLLTIESDLLILTETQITSKCCTNGDVVKRSLPYHMAMLKPEVHSDFLYSSVEGNYSFGFNGRRRYLFKQPDGRLVAPLILYNLHSKNFGGGFVNNILQPDFYSNLAAGDTVSLREYQLLFEK